ncbi:MAG: Asd/ArgC dimerization domain-containing protein [Pyrinomonadaceae bacterium]
MLKRRATRTTHSAPILFYAYKPFTHQHVPEIEQELRRVGDWTSEFVFMTHSLPVPRGIFASIYVELNNVISIDDADQLFTEFYRDSPFVRLVQNSPDINWVKTTNYCDIGLAMRGHQMVVSQRWIIWSKGRPARQFRI